MMRPTTCALAFMFAVAAVPGAAFAHSGDVGITGKKFLLKTEPKSSKRKFLFKSVQDPLIFADEDPAGAAGSALLVQTLDCTPTSVGESCDQVESTGLITLSAAAWKGLGNPSGSKGYKYVDKTAASGGIKVASYKNGALILKASGAAWPLAPDGARDRTRVQFRAGDRWYCAEFGGTQLQSEAGFLAFKDAPAPVECPEQTCGNGEVELPEACDDGNFVGGDGCEADCTIGACVGQSFASTWDAIQTVIFQNQGCTNGICHGAAMLGGLDLRPPNAHANLINMASSIDPLRDRVEPGDQDLSILWLKLAENTQGNSNLAPGSGMPVGGAISADELEALRLWIRGGAPQTGVVDGTAELLSSCLPPPVPGKIPPPAPPAVGVGAQLLQTPWPLMPQAERELCMSTFYDWTGPGIVPASAIVPCPWGATTINPTGQCVAWHSQTLYQDPQSHHSILSMYLGTANVTDAGWGAWTYKSGANVGQSCDPTAVDATGINPACSGAIVTSLACIGYGPSDHNATTAPNFGGSQEPLSTNLLASGVYSLLPIRGMVTWNSHAFNLTETASTMDQYLNLDFATPANQLYPAQGIFDDDRIFAQNVPPFETAEYCDTFIIPTGANLFYLSSHMHKRGKQFRIWGPPNASCSGSGCTANAGAPLYLSTVYADPLQLYFEPSIVYTGTTTNRRFKFCALYDNGATDIQKVKRRSNSPTAIVGGPCAIAETRCIGGPNHNALCNGVNATCDSAPAAGDGDCDACPLRGGVTTEDEMLIMLGTYYVP